VLAMPSKRYEKRTIDFLTRAEIEAVIRAADPTLGRAVAIECSFCSPCRPAFACRS
jgi:hypothetical protein